MNITPTQGRAAAPNANSEVRTPEKSPALDTDPFKIVPFGAGSSIFGSAEKNLNRSGADSVGPLSIPSFEPALEHQVLPQGTRIALNTEEVRPRLGNRPDLHLIKVTGAEVILAESAPTVLNEVGESVLTSPARGFVNKAEIKFPGDPRTIRFDQEFPVELQRGAKVHILTQLAA